MTAKPPNMPCGEPEYHNPSVNVQKFSKLSEELQKQQGGRHPTELEQKRMTNFQGVYFNKLKSASTCGSPNSGNLGGFLVTHASTTNASCIIDPLKVLNKSPLDTLLARGATSKDKPKDTSYLADTLKKFDKQVWFPKGANAPAPDVSGRPSMQAQKGSDAPAPAPTSLVETRNVSSSCVSVHEDYDEDYHEVSDAETEPDADAEAYPEIDQYMIEAKSKDSFLNIIYEDALAKKPKKSASKQLSSDVSNDSVLESGYKSNHSCTTTSRVSPEQRPSDDLMPSVSRRIELVSSTPARDSNSTVCRSFAAPASVAGTESVPSSSAPEDSSEQISKLIVDLIGPKSRVGKLIFQSCSNSQDMDCILEEIKQCVQADLQVEDKLTSFFRNQHHVVGPVATASSAGPSAIVKYDTLRNLDDTLLFVKENLTQIRADLNEFKEHSYKKIDSKVSYTEFSDATAILRAKMTYLERKIFNEHRIMRQDIRNFREKISFLENEASCGLKNFPIWPFIAFIGAYSIINLGRR